jgi:hypothetical protein
MGAEIGELALVGAVERNGALVDDGALLHHNWGRGGLDGAVVAKSARAVDEASCLSLGALGR